MTRRMQIVVLSIMAALAISFLIFEELGRTGPASITRAPSQPPRVISQ